MRALTYLSILIFSACPSPTGTGPAQKNTPAQTEMAASTPPTPYTITAVADCGEATGDQTVMVKTAAGAAFVTLSEGTTSSPCTPMDRPTIQVKNYDICFGETTSGTAVTVSKVTSQPYVSLAGVGIGAGSNGSVSVAYTGGPNAAIRCGASDMLITTKPAGGAFAAPTTLAASSMAPFPQDQAAECVQGVCDKGDATGFWPAVTYAGGTTPIVAFRDTHFGFAGDDFEKSDVELYRGSVGTVDVAQGGGLYNRVAATSDGRLTLVWYNGDGPSSVNGIWAARETDPGVFDRQRIANVKIGEVFGFDIAANGQHAVTFYNADKKTLQYLESNDGNVWSEPENVDTNGDTGRNPSLAFDASNEPAIAYYRCNDRQTSGTSCDANKDGLLLARRSQGLWNKQKIVGEGALEEGEYSAITFIGGKVLIAYKKVTFDPSSGTSKRALLAKEP